MTCIPSQKLPVKFHIEPERVTKEVAQFPAEQWLPHVNTGVYQGEWDVLPLRCTASSVKAHPILQAFNIQQADGWAGLTSFKKNAYHL